MTNELRQSIRPDGRTRRRSTDATSSWISGRELDQLQREPEWDKGQNAKTRVKYDNVRVVLTSLKPHGRRPEHVTQGRITIQTIHGHLLVRADQRTFDLPPGALLALDHELAHDVEAI